LGSALGELSSRRIVDPWRRRVVRLVPVRFAAPPAPALRPDPREVAEARWVDALAAERVWRWHRIRGVVPWPVRGREIEGGLVWGLTGAILDDLARQA
jgi:hypothetical protein